MAGIKARAQCVCVPRLPQRLWRANFGSMCKRLLLSFLSFGALRLFVALLGASLVLQGLAAVSMAARTPQSMAMVEMQGKPCNDCSPAKAQDCIAICVQAVGIVAPDTSGLAVERTEDKPLQHWSFTRFLHDPFAQPPPVPPIVD